MKEKIMKIKLTLKGRGLSYEKEVNAEIAGHIMALCLSSGESITKPERFLNAPILKTSFTKESPAEYMNRYSPQRNPDRILTCVGYLSETSGKDSFHPNEIKNLFRDGGEVIPANFSRDLRWVISSGWIAPDPKKRGNFYITNTGLKVLKEGFSKEVIKKSRFKTKGLRRKSKKSKEGNA